LALSNGHSHSDGSTDHGVVAHRKVVVFAVFIVQKQRFFLESTTINPENRNFIRSNPFSFFT